MYLRGIISSDVLPSHDCSNELMFLDDGVGVYKSKVSDTGNTRDMDRELVSDSQQKSSATSLQLVIYVTYK